MTNQDIQNKLDQFIKDKLETTWTIQYFDEEHGWLHTYPIITYTNEDEVKSFLPKLAELYPSFRFRIKEDTNEKI